MPANKILKPPREDYHGFGAMGATPKKITRITPEVKAIADAHIEAKKSGKFDDVPVSSKEELIRLLKEGKTFSAVLNEIELRFVSITSNIFARVLDYTTDAYVKSVRKGFKKLLQN